MIASAGPYPSFFEHIPESGPFVQGLLLLLLVAFFYGLYRLWRVPSLTIGSLLLIGAPSIIGCGLAALQSLIAEGVVQINENGMAYFSRPDRYIGHLRIFLGIGISMSVVLLCIVHFARRPPAPSE
jgi:hypothetical protein